MGCLAAAVSAGCMGERQERAADAARLERIASAGGAARLESADGSLEVSLVGGQVTSWQPAALGGGEAFFMSGAARWGEEVHGGVPICWPWFSRREGAPWHGVARYVAWRPAAAPGGGEGRIALVTSSDDWTRQFFPHEFSMRAEYAMPAPDTLEISVTEMNAGDEPFESVFGFHPYFAVADSGRCTLDGAAAPPPDGETMIFPADGAAHTLGDPVRGVVFSVEAPFADTWYFWNCGPKSKRLADGEWRSFYCLEPLRRAPAALAPGESRTHTIRIRVRRESGGARGEDGMRTPAVMAPPPDWRERMWRETVALRDGLTVRARALEEPRRMKAYVARVDLGAPGIGFTATERAPNWGESMNDPAKPERLVETKCEATIDFLSRRRAEERNVWLAVNTTPWTPFPVPKGIEYFNAWGWCVEDGVEVSPPKSCERLFVARRDGSVAILYGTDILAEATNGVAVAVSGYNILIRDGEDVFENERGGIHQRTALGLADGGRTLVVLVVDGRNPEWSEGADMADLRRLLHAEGVTDAVNFDGGGSSALVVYDPVSGEPAMLNRHKNGSIRKVAVNLGVEFERE